MRRFCSSCFLTAPWLLSSAPCASQAGQKLDDNLKKEQAATAASKLRKAIDSSKHEEMSHQVGALPCLVQALRAS